MAAAATGARATAVEPFAPDAAVDSTRALYERHGGAIFRFCRSRLRSREEAEDAGQTTFLHAFRALRRGVVPVSELSWLLKIAENVCKNRRVDAKRRLALEIAEDPEQLGRIAAPAAADPELLIPLEDALGRLTEAQRQALLLREWQGLSYREIAARLGIGQGAVEVLIFRARRALAEELETPGRRRRARALDLGWLAGLAKQLLGGGMAAKAALAAVAAGVAAAVTTVAVAVGSDSPRPVEPTRPERAAPAAPVQERAVVPERRRAQAAAAPASQAERTRVEPAGTGDPAAPAPAESPRPAPERAEGGAVPPDESPRLAAVQDVTGTVAPVVGTVTPTVEALVGAVEGAVEDVVGTVEPVVPAVPDPGLPGPPPLP